MPWPAKMPGTQSSLDPEEVARFDRLARRLVGRARSHAGVASIQSRPGRVICARLLTASTSAANERGAWQRAPARRSRPSRHWLRRRDSVGTLGGLGAEMTALDPAPANIAVARGIRRCRALSSTISARRQKRSPKKAELFDVVLAMEVVEHVREREGFHRRRRPHGEAEQVSASRQRSTGHFKSYAFAIVGAEYVLRWLPKGTHRWEHFVTPRRTCRGTRPRQAFMSSKRPASSSIRSAAQWRKAVTWM